MGVGGGDPMSIGVFARRSRLSMKALRLYDRLGLLTPAHVDPATGYRLYVASQLATARLIATLRRLDMPLARVAEVVSGPDGRGADLVASYWEEVERRTASKRELVGLIRTGLLSGDGRHAPLEVRRREVPEQLVLAARRRVRLLELAGWVRPTVARLRSLADGGAGRHFVIFHGEVREDAAAPVEVCVPVASARLATRSEPAHQEAYVTLTRAQFEFPQVLSAYDAVERWVSERELRWAGSPREVYFPDATANAVCDVALPFR